MDDKVTEKAASLAETAAVHRPFAREAIEQPIHARFFEQVARFGDRTAIHTPRYRWSYEELRRQVDSMAAQVLERCGADNGRLGLLFKHDAPMCASVLAALRAGKTYVPLDPGYPIARLRMMLDDCQPQAILVDPECLDLGRELCGHRWPLLPAAIGASPTRREFPSVDPRCPAYILYTSGSTGRPKGVVQNHRNVLHFIRAYTNNLGFCAADRLSLLSSYSFDAAVMAIYGALLNGACLCPRSVAEVGFAGIAQWVRDFELSVYHSTPTVFRYFLGTANPGERFERIRRVVLGGEPVVPSDVELFKRHFVRGATMVNGLGPTESTVTLEYFINHDTVIDGHTVPVGRPVCDTEIVLLDENGKETQSEGELVFVSEHVALGYYGRDDLTEKAFGTFPDRPGRRFYRSGDFARYRPDGNLDFLGRRDQQVKIHGVRIELGEIDAAASRFPGVETCITFTVPGPNGELQLAAAIKAKPSTVAEDDLRQFLVGQLIPAMVPSSLVLLAEFPLTPTGKVDRLSLAEVVRDHSPRSKPSSTFVASTPTEDILLEAWRAVLGHGPASAEADFFQEGGDSLAAVRLRDHVQARLQRSMSLGRLFELRTFGALAASLDHKEGPEASGAALIPLTNYGEASGAHLICICGIELYRPLAEAIGPPHRVSGVFLPIEEKVLRGEEMPELPAMARMYGDAIREHQPHGPYYLAGVSFGGLLAYELSRQLKAAGEEIRYLGIFDTVLPQTISKLRRIYAHLMLTVQEGPRYATDKVLNVCDRKAPALRQLMSRFSCVPAKTDVASSEPLVDLRAQLYNRALERYRRQMPSYDGDLCYYRAAEREAFERFAFPLDCNWPRYVKGRFQVFEVPGGHISMLAQTNVACLAGLVRRALG